MQLLVNIVVLASIYALIACGYVMIYRVSRVLNLAHGELMMLGAYMLLATASLFSGHAAMALGAAIVLSVVVGLLVYVFLMRKMTGEMVLAAILTTVALGILIRGLVVLLWSAQQQYPAQALGVTNPSLVIGSARISLWSAVLVLTNIAVYAGLFAFLRFGRWGIRMRAAGQNPLLAAQRGIKLHSVYALAWSSLNAHRRACRHSHGAQLRSDYQSAGDRAQSVPSGIGGWTRQPGGGAGRRADRRRRRGSIDLLR